MPSRPPDRGSLLLVEEFFAGEDDGFVEALRQVDQPKLLAAFADRWNRETRPWARRQKFAYLEQPFDRAGHQPVIKRLFKHAEATHDDELMAAFLVAFDRHVRRRIRQRWTWDSTLRTGVQQEVLAAPRDVLPVAGQTFRNPATGRLVPVRTPAGASLFKYGTRYYLRRRAWRYFRHAGYQRPAEYPRIVAAALRRYRDTDFAAGENILDSWGLLHACFGEHEALEFAADHPRLKEARSFGELSSAPAFPETWKRPESAGILFDLLGQAASRLVRVWATQLLEREHPTFQADVTRLRRLLEHDDEEMQQLGARLLAKAPGLATLPVSDWLELLQTRNPEALAAISELFARHVAAGRLTLAEKVRLAASAPAPVARLGLGMLRENPPGAAERAELLPLAEAQCRALAGELTAWALGILGASTVYETDVVLRFLDSLRAEVCAAAWDWLQAEGSPGQDDPVLWSRLIETPFDDLRLRLVDALERPGSQPNGRTDELKPLWTAVLLGVHRGGRQKARAVHQLAAALVREPERLDSLLPVLAVAVRSVRRPESRAGLAAVVRVVEARPELTERVRRFLPELQFP